jgi:MFS transporter, ACS family, allantoate permease
MVYEFFKSVPNGGLTNFGTLVIKGFGFNSFHTLLIGLPTSVVSAGSMLIWGYFSIKYGNLRTWGMIVPLIIAIAGVSAVYATQGTDASPYGRVVAYWLINSYSVTVRYILSTFSSPEEEEEEEKRC